MLRAIDSIAVIDDIPAMGVLTVRNIDDALIKRLRIRAAENGRSAEAEHREILRQALGRDRKQLVEELRLHLRSFQNREFPDMTKIIRKMRDRPPRL